jgi:hypothetical protein
MAEFMAVVMAVAGFSMMIMALAMVFTPAAWFVGGGLLVVASGRVMQDAVE